MRELRADFRHWYHVRYEDVATDEAVDLILSLPMGSMYLAALSPYWAWSEERNAIADVCDLQFRAERLTCTRSTEGAHRITRPRDVYERRQALDKAKAAKQKMETTKWELVDDG